MNLGEDEYEAFSELQHQNEERLARAVYTPPPSEESFDEFISTIDTNVENVQNKRRNNNSNSNVPSKRVRREEVLSQIESQIESQLETPEAPSTQCTTKRSKPPNLELKRSGIDEMKARLRNQLESGIVFHTKKPGKLRSDVWNQFHEIRFKETKEKIKFFYFCVSCAEVVDNPYNDGNTNKLKRHACSVPGKENDSSALISTTDKSSLKSASMQFIVKDLRPFSAIEGRGLIELLTAAMRFGQKNRNATPKDFQRAMPTRNTVREAVAKESEVKRKLIGNTLKKAIDMGGIAASTETWTDDYKHITYICIVAHVAIKTNEVIDYQRYILSTSEVSEFIKTGKVLVCHIIDIFKEFGLTEEEVKGKVIFVSDRGANIKYGLIRNGFMRLTCYAHIIHNLVTTMLEEQRVHEVVKKCSKLSSYVKNTGLNKHLKSTIKGYTPTRWNSVCTMIDSIIQNYGDVYDLLVTKQRLMNEARLRNRLNPDNVLSELVSSLDQTELESIRDFLKPFKEMTDKLQADNNITLHMVWPIFCQLQLILSESEDDLINEIDDTRSTVTHMKRVGRSYMMRNKNDFQPTFEHRAMTLLNPTMKKLVSVPSIERRELHVEIEKRLTNTMVDTHHSDEVIEANCNVNFLESFISFDDGAYEPQSELNRYLLQPIHFGTDMRTWWLEHSTIYPKLFELFMKLSCIPATSAGSERAFSCTGNIITDKRSMILPKNVNNLMIVRNDC